MSKSEDKNGKNSGKIKSSSKLKKMLLIKDINERIRPLNTMAKHPMTFGIQEIWAQVLAVKMA